MSARLFRIAIVSLAFLGVSQGSARADSVAYFQASGLTTAGIGNFTGSISVTNINNTSAVIQVAIKNTSPVANGGFVTGFAFNDPNTTAQGNIGTVTSFSQSYAPEGTPPANYMSLIGGPTFANGISGSPYGSFDIGAAVGGDLLGGGTPQPGIEVNQTGTFTFAVSGSSLNNLTAANILNTSSSGTGAVPGIIVRFRGFNNGGSDKIISGQLTTPPPPPPPPPPPAVPAPPAVLMAGIGMACCLLGRLRRQYAGAV